MWCVLPASLVLGAFIACGGSSEDDDVVQNVGSSSSSSGASSASSSTGGSSSSSSSSSSSGNANTSGGPGDADSATGADSATDAAAESGAPDSGDAGSGDAGDDASQDAGADADAALPVTATPTFSTFPPGPGPYPFGSFVEVSLASATPNASIFYTLDGTNPTTKSTPYAFATPIEVKATTTVKAIAVAPGDSVSDVATTTITINTTNSCCTDSVSFVPGSTTQANTFVVAVSYPSDSNATICYTTDGVTSPACTNGVCTGGSQKYNAAVPVPITQTQTTVSALACRASGTTNSGITSQTYDLQAAAVTASPAPGSMAGPVDVKLSSATNLSTIHYTTDGSPVTCTTGIVAAGNPVTLHLTTTTTITAVACRTGFDPSTSSAFMYTLH